MILGDLSLGVPLDRAGRVLVKNDLSVPGHPNVFVIGAVYDLPLCALNSVYPQVLTPPVAPLANVQQDADQHYEGGEDLCDQDLCHYSLVAFKG
jgi:NADH dehydrogenase FAD-containing subunit